jgi:hypothetical protein
MPDAQNAEFPSGIIDMRPDVIVRVAILGLGLGIAVWLVGFLLNRFLIDPVFCSGQSGGLCANTEDVAGNIALIIGAVGGVLGLVRLGIYRPMLVAIAATICLWGLAGWLSGLVWYEALGWTALIYMVAYAAFAWLVRPRNFFAVIVMLLIVIVAARFLVSLP